MADGWQGKWVTCRGWHVGRTGDGELTVTGVCAADTGGDGRLLVWLPFFSLGPSTFAAPDFLDVPRRKSRLASDEEIALAVQRRGVI